MERRFKGIWIPKNLWETNFTPSQKLLLSEIDSLYDEKLGGCYASNEYLAKTLHVTKRTIIRGIRKLQENGTILVDYKTIKKKKVRILVLKKEIYSISIKNTKDKSRVTKCHPPSDKMSPPLGKFQKSESVDTQGVTKQKLAEFRPENIVDKKELRARARMRAREGDKIQKKSGEIKRKIAPLALKIKKAAIQNDKHVEKLINNNSIKKWKKELRHFLKKYESSGLDSDALSNVLTIYMSMKEQREMPRIFPDSPLESILLKIIEFIDSKLYCLLLKNSSDGEELQPQELKIKETPLSKKIASGINRVVSNTSLPLSNEQVSHISKLLSTWYESEYEKRKNKCKDPLSKTYKLDKKWMVEHLSDPDTFGKKYADWFWKRTRDWEDWDGNINPFLPPGGKLWSSFIGKLNKGGG